MNESQATGDVGRGAGVTANAAMIDAVGDSSRHAVIGCGTGRVTSVKPAARRLGKRDISRLTGGSHQMVDDKYG